MKRRREQADVTEELLGKIAELGGTVVSSLSEYQALRVRIPIESVEELAEPLGVSSIRPADEYQLHRRNPPEEKEGPGP